MTIIGNIKDRWAVIQNESFAQVEKVTKERVAKGICTVSLGEKFCTKSTLGFFNWLAPKGEADFDENGNDAVAFKWNDADYQLVCGGGICSINRMPAVAKTGIADRAAVFVSALSAGCEASKSDGKENVGQYDDNNSGDNSGNEPVNSNPPTDNNSIPAVWPFCAKLNVEGINNEENCYSNEDIKALWASKIGITKININGSDILNNENEKLPDILFYSDQKALFCFELMGFRNEPAGLDFQCYELFPSGFAGNQQNWYPSSALVGSTDAPKWPMIQFINVIYVNPSKINMNIYFQQQSGGCISVYNNHC